MTHQLIIIGAGPGGYEVAVKAAKSGLSVLIVEARHVGGTCLNEGCIPTKCLCRNAALLQEIKDAATFGITTGAIQFDLATAIERKNSVVERLTTGIQTLLKTPGITLVNGNAKFVDNHTIEVDGTRYSADHIIIATGSVSKFLPIEGAHSQGVVTSTELLDTKTIPDRLCIIGGGVIGMEFASIFNAFGSEVTVIEYCKEILPAFDRDIAKRLRTALKKQGISFKTGAAVTAIRHEDGHTIVEYTEKSATRNTEADLVLMAVGRVANTDSLNLTDAGIAFTPKGITVNENMQTSVPHIYAVGDINGLCQLAHAATFQGYRALNHILGKTDDIDFDIIPAAVFTLPEVASVGLSEESAEAKGISYSTHKAFYRANGKALSMGEEEGVVKLLTDTNGIIIGCHIIGKHAADIIHEAALLIRHRATLSQLSDSIHAHPSISEIFLATVE
ncbi:MAG: dihydrolipoyl dehydrogenase [Bacteroides sp.]|nr:dihydrolipoyl dehydrogenase [Bacteroides sp.]MCM1448487.1 dihydrolipoyl dehydrogenase [Bacteroides sp.]